MNRARIARAGLVAWFLLPGSSPADVQIGYLESYDRSELIYDSTIPHLMDNYFEDGSKGDGRVSTSNVIIQTQCYSGDHLDNFNDTKNEPGAGGTFHDPAEFPNTTVVTGNEPGKVTTYAFLNSLVTVLLPLARTADGLHFGTGMSKAALLRNNPQIQGTGGRRLRGESSTHVLIWASQPDPVHDKDAIRRIVQAFPPVADGTTTVHVLAGDGTPAQTGPQTPGVVYRPATREDLRASIENIGGRMDDGPDEVFDLFVIDHGGKARIDVNGGLVPVSSPSLPGIRSFALNPPHSMLAPMVENASLCGDPTCQPHLSLFTLQVPGIDFDPMQLVPHLQRPGAPPVSLGTAGPGQVYPTEFGDGLSRYELRYPLSTDALVGSTPGLLPREGIAYGVIVQNFSLDTPVNLDAVGMFTGPIPPDPPELNYSKTLCGGNPAFGCSVPNLYLRLNESLGAGAGPQMIVNHAGPTGPTDGYLGFGDAPGSSDIGSPGPRTPAFPGFPITNLAPHFDGIDDWIRIASQDLLNPTGGFSLTAWLKPDPGAGSGTILSKSNPVGDRRAYSLTKLGSGQLELRVSPDGRGGVLHETVLVSPEPLSTQTWQQIVASVGGDALRLCVNGREVARQVFGAPTSVRANDVSLAIGSAFDGQIDQAALIPRPLTTAECEKLADQGLGPISNAFGFPLSASPGVSIGTNSPRGIEAGPFDDSGNAILRFGVGSAPVLAQGFNARVDAPWLDTTGTALFVGAFGRRGAIQTFLGGAGVQPAAAAGQRALFVDFNALGVPTVLARMLYQGIQTGSFTAPAGVVATMPHQDVEELGVLEPIDALGTWGYRVRFRSAAALAPAGGGTPLTGDELLVTAPGFPRSQLTQVLSVDVVGKSHPFVAILDAAAGPLPEVLPGDIDEDGDVDREDVTPFLAYAYQADPTPKWDLNRDGVVDMNDGRLLIDLVQLGPSSSNAVKAVDAAAAVAPVLELQTGSPTLEVGEPLALDLALSGLAGTLGAFALELRYDAALFTFEGISFGSALGTLDGALDHAVDPAAQTAVFAFGNPGAIQLYVVSLLDQAQLAPLQQSGSLTLATLDFTALAPGTAQFEPAAVDMVDGAQPPGDLAPLTQGVQVQVSCADADTDADSICDAADNCPFFASASLADADGDGRGDDCECSDQNGDGENTVSDLIAINTAIFNPGQVTPLCDGNNDGNCNVNDIIAANVEIFSPTSTSTCARQPVPGP